MIEKKALSWDDFEQILKGLEEEYPEKIREFLYRGHANEINALSWDDLEQILKDLKEEHPEKIQEFLYRRRAKSKWKLETTLERRLRKKIKIYDYYDFIVTFKGKIETVTNKTWAILSKEKYSNWLKEMRSDSIIGFPECEYFAYLRHHGFPSPLLDWSKSPYVAAYFAMNEANESESSEVSIFVYLETKTLGKIRDNQRPGIYKLDQSLKTHKRHYLQQSVYTICSSFEDGNWYYANHEDVFLEKDANQDLLWRINIPKSNKKIFLSKLENMNINSYSLLQTEDALMNHIFILESYLGGHL